MKIAKHPGNLSTGNHCGRAEGGGSCKETRMRHLSAHNIGYGKLQHLGNSKSHWSLRNPKWLFLPFFQSKAGDANGVEGFIGTALLPILPVSATHPTGI
jgi:hypothetical protein